jgi:hypothetical protein
VVSNTLEGFVPESCTAEIVVGEFLRKKMGSGGELGEFGEAGNCGCGLFASPRRQPPRLRSNTWIFNPPLNTAIARNVGDEYVFCNLFMLVANVAIKVPSAV